MRKDGAKWSRRLLAKAFRDIWILKAVVLFVSYTGPYGQPISQSSYSDDGLLDE